jgi:hypothetical protein
LFYCLAAAVRAELPPPVISENPGFALVAGSAVLARITPFRREAERLATGGVSPLELLAVHVERNLAGEHESLVGGKLVGELAQAADVVPISKAPPRRRRLDRQG